MKTILKAILLLGIVAYLVWAVVQYARPTERQVCTDVKVSVQDSAASGLVSHDYVLGILGQRHISPKGMRLSSISLRGLDSLVTADPYVARASCHFTSAGVLCIDVVPRKPVMHVIQDDGDEYYMTDGGEVIPASLAMEGLCLATGHLRRSFAKGKLLPLAAYINDDEFWSLQVEQVYVTPSGQVEIIPRVGRHVVRLGSTDHYQDKLRRLRYFYQYGMPKVGWNRYKTINLAYDGQIVCTK